MPLLAVGKALPVLLPRRVVFAFAALLSLTALGTVGYRTLEGWSWIDALYMTVITLSTVGFSEVHPLSFAGRIFTLVLIVVGVGLALYLLSVLAEAVLEGRLRELFKRSAMQKRVETLEKHVIVCGFGRFGSNVVEELLRTRTSLVVIESDAAKEPELRDGGVPYLLGSAASDETLEVAGIQRAHSVVIATSSEAENVFITLAARELNRVVPIIARGESEAAIRRLRRAGATQVTSPFRVGGQRAAASVLRPSVVDFLEIAAPTSDPAVDLEEIRIGRGSPLHGRPLASLENATPRLRIVAVKRGAEAIQLMPDTAMELRAGDHLVVIGERERLAQLARLAQASGVS